MDDDSKKYILAAVLVATILFLAWRVISAPGGTYSQTTSSGIKWKVSTRYSNAAAAGELIDSLNQRLMRFFAYLRKKYHIGESDDTVASEGPAHTAAVTAYARQRQHVDHMLRNYNYEAILENDPAVSKDTSLTIGKGEVLYLCLRRRDNPEELIDEHTLFFVLLHEVSHIANYSGFGHKQDFWRVFKFILGEAREAGVHEPAKYAERPIVYCGLYVDYSPYWDTSLGGL